MLRPAEDTSVDYEPVRDDQGWLVLQVGDNRFRLRLIEPVNLRAILRSTAVTPHRVATAINGDDCWMFQENYFWAEDSLTADEVQRELA